MSTVKLFIVNNHLRRREHYFAIELLFPCNGLVQKVITMAHWAPRILFSFNLQASHLQSILEIKTLMFSKAVLSKTRKHCQMMRCEKHSVAPTTELYLGKVLLPSTREIKIYTFQDWSEEDQGIWPRTVVSLPAFNSVDIWRMWDKSRFRSRLLSLSCN